MKQSSKSASSKSVPAAAALRIDGDMTIYQADDLKRKLLGTLASAGPSLQVDLRNVGEIDTAGVQLLIAAKHAAAGLGKSLVLTASSPAVAEVFQLFGLVDFFADPLSGTA